MCAEVVERILHQPELPSCPPSTRAPFVALQGPVLSTPPEGDRFGPSWGQLISLLPILVSSGLRWKYWTAPDRAGTVRALGRRGRPGRRYETEYGRESPACCIPGWTRCGRSRRARGGAAPQKCSAAADLLPRAPLALWTQHATLKVVPTVRSQSIALIGDIPSVVQGANRTVHHNAADRKSVV